MAKSPTILKKLCKILDTPTLSRLCEDMELSRMERELIDLYNPSHELTTRDLDFSNPTNYLQRGQYLEDQILFFLASRPTYFRSEVYLEIALAGIRYAEK